MPMGAIRALVVAIAVGVAALVVAGPAPTARAATAPVGSFPVWSATSATTFTGQLSSAAGGGAISVVTTGTGAQVAESGTASFLGQTTGFGQRFGSSRYQSYLTIGLAAGNADSTTTITLPSTMPAGWGLAVGDIDADMVAIDATGPGGAVTATQLNPQDTGGTPLLNYCNNASPKPSSCGPGTSFTDAPWWCPALPGTGHCAPARRDREVVGNGVDTKGAYDWFVPTVAITQLTLTYQLLSGSPSFQLWIVAPAAATSVSGRVDQAGGAAAPAGTTLEVSHGDGTPVLDLLDQQLTVPVAADGTYAFTTEQGDYRLKVDPPEGYQSSGTGTLAFTASADSLSLPTLALTPTLPATGSDARPLFGAAGALLVLGALLSALALRRSRRMPRSGPGR